MLANQVRVVSVFVLLASAFFPGLSWADKANDQRIMREIKENMSMLNREPERRDDMSDDERWLYADRNEAVLINRKTGERIGLFEPFGSEKNVQKYEIRRFLGKKVIGRYDSFLSKDCSENASVSVLKQFNDVTFINVSCRSNVVGKSGAEQGMSMLALNKSDGRLYVFYSDEGVVMRGPTFKRKLDGYDVNFSYRQTGNKEVYKVSMWVGLVKDKNNQMILGSTGNDEWGQPGEQKKLPNDPIYDLP
ncbi:hypothetical protein HNQ59_003967 [Chitinivorax tropicus]|uniref:Uncharacterized protein n=1 Tax=Chitinivorax tropicus TaxID=714531 RepID=A0A840MV10_9PROT|nr:hypothetical protein [Chitinivorax tropicus]MBB5020642.1 hypothetical protein [Chitinivorax tropicus]